MAIVSPLRARRNANRPVESTQQVIIFCLRQQWFALPMEVVKRVSSLKSNSSSAQQIATVAAPDDGMTILDADPQIFSESRSVLNSKSAAQSEGFLIVFQTSSGEAYGLRVSEPKMHRITQSDVAAFSATDSVFEPMHCVSGVVKAESRILYLLDPDQLCQSA